MAETQTIPDAEISSPSDNFDYSQFDQTDDDEVPIEAFLEQDGEPDETEQSVENDPEKEDEETERIELFGESFDPDELQELIGKGKGFTQKSQALAEDRRYFETEVGAIRGLTQALEHSPEAARLALSHLVEYAQQKHGPAIQHAQQDIDEEDFSDEGLALARMVQRMNAENNQLRNMLGHQAEKFRSIEEFMGKHGGVIAETALRANAAPMIKEIQRIYKVDVTPDELAEAVRSTGEQDPIKAWKLTNFDRLTSANFRRGYDAASRKPRSTPEPSSVNAFDPSGMTADEIHAHLRAGKTVRRR